MTTLYVRIGDVVFDINEIEAGYPLASGSYNIILRSGASIALFDNGDDNKYAEKARELVEWLAGEKRPEWLPSRIV